MTTLMTSHREQWLESVFDRFEAMWHDGSEPLIDEFLDDDWEPARRQQVFDELLLIDLEHRWRRPCRVASGLHGSADSSATSSTLPLRPKLEDYAARWPDYLTLDRLSIATIRHEFQVRCEVGEPPETDEYLNRFPAQAAELKTALAEELASHLAIRSKTKPHAGHSTNQGKTLEPAISTGRRLTPGEQLGRYRVLWTIGHGAMGMVYLAYDPDLDRQVALKVPFLDGPHAERLAQRFRREAKLTASLRHPNICRVLDVDRQNGLDFLTMDYIEGTSLEALLKSSPSVPPARAAMIVQKIAHALQEAHAAGVIHRDIKPSNILIDRRGEPVLTDFGLARRPDVDASEQTRPGEWLGTPAYMAPEQFSGLAEDVSPACDIFSLGVVLYRLLTGQRPFADKHRRDELVKRVLPTAPALVKPGIPAELSTICMKALSFDPQQRFASAAEFARAIEPFAEDSLATEWSSWPNVDPTVKSGTSSSSRHDRSRMVVVLSAGLLTFAFAVAGNAWWTNHSASTPTNSGATSSSRELWPQLGLELENSETWNRLPRVELHVQRADQTRDYQVLGPELGSLHDADKIQFRISLDTPAYVAVFYIDARGIISRRYPVIGESAEVVKELWDPPLAGPNELQAMHLLGGATGMEFVVAVASPTPFVESELLELERLRVQPIAESVGFGFVVDRGLSKETIEGSDKMSLEPRLTMLPLGADPRHFLRTTSAPTRGLSGVTATRKSEALAWDRFTERLVRLGEVAHGLAFHHAP